jgi:hypothetical protein
MRGASRSHASNQPEPSARGAGLGWSVQHIGASVEVEPKRRHAVGARPELNGAQQAGQIAGRRPQLRRNEPNLIRLDGHDVPAGPQSFAEALRSVEAQELEHECLVEVVRRHGPSIAAAEAFRPDADASFAVG